MKIDELMNEWGKDSNLDESDIGKESINVPTLHSKYMNYLLKEISLHKILNSEYKTLYKLKWEYYLGYLDKSDLDTLGWEPFQFKILKTDINIFLEGDKDLSSKKIKLEMQEEKIKYIENVIKSINSRNFSIKNYIDWKKFENGLM